MRLYTFTRLFQSNARDNKKKNYVKHDNYKIAFLTCVVIYRCRRIKNLLTKLTHWTFCRHYNKTKT